MSDRIILKPYPVKVEGRIVPIAGKIDDTIFRFGMHPSEFVEYVQVSIIGVTSDIDLVASLSSAQAANMFNYIVSTQNLLPPHRTVYLNIQSVKYKRPEMQHYPAGSLLKDGSLELEGMLLSKEPEQTISLNDLVRYLNLNKVRQVDYDSPDSIGHTRAES